MFTINFGRTRPDIVFAAADPALSMRRASPGPDPATDRRQRSGGAPGPSGSARGAARLEGRPAAPSARAAARHSGTSMIDPVLTCITPGLVQRQSTCASLSSIGLLPGRDGPRYCAGRCNLRREAAAAPSEILPAGVPKMTWRMCREKVSSQPERAECGAACWSAAGPSAADGAWKRTLGPADPGRSPQCGGGPAAGLGAVHAAAAQPHGAAGSAAGSCRPREGPPGESRVFTPADVRLPRASRVPACASSSFMTIQLYL